MDAPGPTLLLTMGDVAGIGPEVIARAWADRALPAGCRPLVVGNVAVMRRALGWTGADPAIEVTPIATPEEAQPAPDRIPVLDPGGDVSGVPPGQVDARAGRAAHDYLIAAVDLTRAGRAEAIVTLPLNKEALHAAGVRHPGHTEILAERCGVREHAMMLWLRGLGVVHVTLHMALRHIFEHITVDSVFAALGLADRTLPPLLEGRRPRLAVAGLNPHAGEGGLFGDEEQRILAPAVARARASGIDAAGPIAADTLFARASHGEFDGVIAMYHDQGHVALKTIGFDRAVNITCGLPIVRTSVAHGTAYDLAGTGRARADSLIEATDVAIRLASFRSGPHRGHA